jgi:hypothetical protein
MSVYLRLKKPISRKNVNYYPGDTKPKGEWDFILGTAHGYIDMREGSADREWFEWVNEDARLKFDNPCVIHRQDMAVNITVHREFEISDIEEYSDRVVIITKRKVPEYAYTIIKDYQIRVDQKIVSIPAGTKIREKPMNGSSNVMVYEVAHDDIASMVHGRQLLIKKSILENNPEYFEPVSVVKDSIINIEPEASDRFGGKTQFEDDLPF